MREVSDYLLYMCGLETTDLLFGRLWTSVKRKGTSLSVRSKKKEKNNRNISKCFSLRWRTTVVRGASDVSRPYPTVPGGKESPSHGLPTEIFLTCHTHVTPEYGTPYLLPLTTQLSLTRVSCSQGFLRGRVAPRVLTLVLPQGTPCSRGLSKVRPYLWSLVLTSTSSGCVGLPGPFVLLYLGWANVVGDSSG